MTYIYRLRQKFDQKNILPIAAFVCLALWLLPASAAYTAQIYDVQKAEQERLRNLPAYKQLDQMDADKGIYTTQSFIMNELPRLMAEKYNPASNDQLRAIFAWMRDWADRGKNPAYGFLYAEHLYAILLNKNNNLQDLQIEDIGRQTLESYFLSFQLMREDMARCGGESRTYVGNATFLPILARFKIYKELFDTMEDHQKRLIVRYTLDKSDLFKNRLPRIDFCKKNIQDNEPELIADDDWLILREKYRTEFREKLFPPED